MVILDSYFELPEGKTWCDVGPKQDAWNSLLNKMFSNYLRNVVYAHIDISSTLRIVNKQLCSYIWKWAY